MACVAMTTVDPNTSGVSASPTAPAPNAAARLASARWFAAAVTAVILFNAVLQGAETSHALMARFGGLFVGLNWVIQGIFTVEILIRLAAYWPRPGRFFRDGWNIFDFVIVIAALLPAYGPFAAVARLARLLRVVRLVSVSPKMRLIVSTMLRSIPSMGHVVLLLGVLLYIYAVIGVNLYRDTDPQHWGDLGKALLTLFTVLTLEGWADMQAAVMADHPWAWVFFSSFIVIAVFVVINLFIAVVTNNLQEAKAEEGLDSTGRGSIDDPAALAARIRADLDRLEAMTRR